MNNSMQRLVRTLISVSVLSLVATLSWSQSLTWLGTLNGSYSRANGVSDNGVVVGDINPNFQQRGFRWQNGVMQLIGDQPDVTVSSARGVSADGSVVVGDMNLGAAGIRAYRWQNGVMQDLGSLSSVAYARALGVSADGSVIVGDSRLTTGDFRAFRWQNGVMQNLGTLTFGNSQANGVSADGTVVVGTANNNSRAFRWQNGVMQDLGTLGGSEAAAYAVSADGSVVVGGARNAAGRERAFRWQNGVMQDLGTLGRQSSFATAVSADGARIVGRARNEDGRRETGFLWTPTDGMQDLNLLYADLLSPRSSLSSPLGISPNGRYIVGQGFNGQTNRFEAFILDTVPEPASMIVLGAGLTGLLALRRRRR